MPDPLLTDDDRLLAALARDGRETKELVSASMTLNFDLNATCDALRAKVARLQDLNRRLTSSTKRAL